MSQQIKAGDNRDRDDWHKGSLLEWLEQTVCGSGGSVKYFLLMSHLTIALPRELSDDASERLKDRKIPSL